MPRETSVNIFADGAGGATSDGVEKLDAVLGEMKRRTSGPNPITDTLGHTANFDLFAIVPTRVVSQGVVQAMMDAPGELKGFN